MLKSILILAVFVIITLLHSFCQTSIDYGYDNAGKRTSRTIHVTAKSGSGDSFIEHSTFKEEIKNDTFLPEMFKYFPNPTTSVLEVEAPANMENTELYLVTVTDKI